MLRGDDHVSTIRISNCYGWRVASTKQTYFSACWTEAVLICAYTVPTETTDLVTTCAREEVDVVNFKRLHAEWAFDRVLLHVRAARHLQYAQDIQLHQ